MKRFLGFIIGITTIIILSLVLILGKAPATADTIQSQPTHAYIYSWLEQQETDWRIRDIPLPKGYDRIPIMHPSFAGWLRDLPLLPPGSPVMLYNGQKKPDQSQHYAVINIDIGSRDFQQCADALMRLRAEYLYSRKQYNDIHFDFVSGFEARYDKWSQGQRIKVSGSKVWWEASGIKSTQYKYFRSYMNRVFEYANSYSLQEETTPIPRREIRVGDMWLIGGFPGHGVMVVDMARDKHGRAIFLIAQSYMPAQSIHILKSFEKISPWYSLDFGDTLVTPAWEFKKDELRRF